MKSRLILLPIVAAGLCISTSCTKTVYVDRTVYVEPTPRPKPVSRATPKAQAARG